MIGIEKIGYGAYKKASTAGISETANYQKPIPDGTKDLYEYHIIPE